jgi:FKBP-type peptidyl-prolyl cis-trans isomerase FkpA
MLRKFIAFSLLLVIAISCEETEEVVDYGPIDQKIIEDYLLAHDLTAQSTSSGLYYIIQNPGTVNHPSVKSIVSVNYKGYLTDGTIFDSSFKNGKPSDLILSAMIQGWQEGLPFIGAGGQIQLFIPSELAYGSKARGIIPANSVLIFEIGLVDFY